MFVCDVGTLPNDDAIDAASTGRTAAALVRLGLRASLTVAKVDEAALTTAPINGQSHAELMSLETIRTFIAAMRFNAGPLPGRRLCRTKL